MDKFWEAAGTKLADRWAAVSGPALVIQVVQGRLDLVLGDEKTEAVPGSSIHLPARLPHTVRATEPSVMLLTMLPATEPSGSGAPSTA
ncbi:cupin domain-containing protein [Streptomyces sp. NPDC006365]|uniref:cupin domain-containing protein n=1 Tax=Streptomyces sp. NPDC006365 TaxID=3364744 RepID=UPI0036B35BB6